MADSREYRQQFWTKSLLFVAILFGILIVLSLIGDRLSRFKVDITSDGLYTLSEPFERILADLEDKVIVTYYASEEFPSLYLTLRRDTDDMFSEIKSLSNGMVEYRVLDPDAEADRVAREQVERYKKAKADNESLDELEPKARDTIRDLFSGMNRKKKTPAEIRERRKQKASAVAEKTGQSVEDAEFEILHDDYKQIYLDNLMEEGVFALRGQEKQGNSIREISFYSALQIKYQNREPETMPQYLNIESLELELAQRILKLTLSEKPKVAFFDGRAPEETPPQNPLQPQQGPRSEYHSLIHDVLGQFFDVRTIRLKEGDAIEDLERKLQEEAEERRKEDPAAPVEDEISCLVVAQPDNLEPRQVYDISRAVSKGIPTILLVSRNSVNTTAGVEGGLPIEFLNPGSDFENMLEEFGVEIPKGVLGSNEFTYYPIPQRMQGLGFVVERGYPFYCMLLADIEHDLIAQDHFLLNRIPGLAVPMTNGVTINGDQIKKNGLSVERLAWTSKETWSVAVSPFSQGQFGQGAGPTTLLNNHANDLVFDPKRRKKREGQDDVSFIDRKELVVLVEGKFPFYYQGKEIPEWKKEEKQDESANDPHGGLNLPPGVQFPKPPGSGGPAGPQFADPADGDDTPAPTAQPAPVPAEAGAEAGGEGEAKSDEKAPAEAPKEKPKGNLEPSSDGKLLVVASVDAFKDRFLVLGNQRGQYPGYRANLQFLRNTIETFGLGNELMKLRAKTLTNRRFVDATDSNRLWVQIINLAIVPLLVVAVGLVRFLLRRKEAMAYERQMAAATEN